MNEAEFIAAPGHERAALQWLLQHAADMAMESLEKHFAERSEAAAAGA